MLNDEGRLLAEGRKQVYVMYFSDVMEIDDTVVRSLLFEAGIIDDASDNTKRKRTGKKHTP
jgi:hypothetical protein